MGTSNRHETVNRWIARSVWIAMTAAAFWFVWRYSDNVPAPDEWSMVPVATGHVPVTWTWLWSPWIGHRLPLPRLVLLGLYRLSGLDFRAAQYLQVAVLAAVSLLLMPVAARFRGRPSWSDGIFPVILLSWVHWYNWLCGWQIQFTLSVALTLLVLICGMYQRWTLAGVCLLLLPLLGSNGLVVAAALIPWFLFQAARTRSGTLVAFAAVTAVEIGFYVFGLSFESPPLYHPAPICRIQDVAEMFGMQVGHGEPRDVDGFTPSLWLGVPIALGYVWAIAALACERLAVVKPRTRKRIAAASAGVALSLIALLGWAKATDRLPLYPITLWQLFGILLLTLVVLAVKLDLRSLIMGAVILMAFGISYKRPFPEFVTTDRYVLLWTPLFVGVYLYGGAVQTPFALLAVLSAFSATPFSQTLAARRHAELRRFVFIVNQGTPLESANFCYRDAFGGRWTDYGVPIYYNPGGSLRSDLQMLHDAGHPTFAGYRSAAATHVNLPTPDRLARVRTGCFASVVPSLGGGHRP